MDKDIIEHYCGKWFDKLKDEDCISVADFFTYIANVDLGKPCKVEANDMVMAVYNQDTKKYIWCKIN